MEHFRQSAPIHRPLFKNVRELEHLGNSCVISFGRPRRRGRGWVTAAIIVGVLLLLSLSGQAGVQGF